MQNNNNFFLKIDFDFDKESKTTPLSVEVARALGFLDKEGKLGSGGKNLGAIFEAWKEVGGKEAAQVTRSVYVRENELVITVSSPIWAQELNVFSSHYCSEINKILEIDSLEKVVFRVQ